MPNAPRGGMADFGQLAQGLDAIAEAEAAEAAVRAATEGVVDEAGLGADVAGGSVSAEQAALAQRRLRENVKSQSHGGRSSAADGSGIAAQTICDLDRVFRVLLEPRPCQPLFLRCHVALLGGAHKGGTGLGRESGCC